MKRILSMIPLLLLFASQAMAAMSCVDSGQIVPERSNGNSTQVVTCTFDTTPGTAVDTIPTDVMARIDGRFCQIDIVPGTTGPTINSDLNIEDSRGLTLVSASSNGLDIIDNSTSTSGILLEGAAGSPLYIPGHAPYVWTVAVTNNAVNNSSFTMYIEAIN